MFLRFAFSIVLRAVAVAACLGFGFICIYDTVVGYLCSVHEAIGTRREVVSFASFFIRRRIVDGQTLLL